MSNIDNIIDKLKVEAEEKIAQIERESKIKSKNAKIEILNNANAEREKILKNAKARGDNTYTRISENAEIRIRDQRLKERQNLIDRVFNLALNKMNSKSDLDFVNEIKSAMENISGDNLTLQVPKSRLEAVKKANLGVRLDEENFVNNGFLIMSDKINYNYSYADILSENRAAIGPQLIEFLSE